MRFLTFNREGKQSWGVTDGSAVTDLGVHLGHDLKHWISTNSLQLVMDKAASLDSDHSIEDIRFDLPIPNPEKIVCIGVNYANRNAEYKDDSALPKYPSVFLRYPDSFTGHGENLVRPPESDKLDYEGEIVLVIGKGGRRIPSENALDHIAGLSIMNEGTLRDWVRHAKFNVTQGKNFYHSGAIGPWMVTPDEVANLEEMSLQTRVNGEVRQDDTTLNMIFPFRYLINYLSTFMPLKPGDMIATGTPIGAGARFDPPKFLKPGDVIEVDVPEVGLLKNGVEDETSNPG